MSSRKPGDWDCPSCGDLQFARNAQCRQCGAAKPGGGGAGGGRPGDWKCASCGDFPQFARNDACRRCGAAKSAPAPPPVAEVVMEEAPPPQRALWSWEEQPAAPVRYYLCVDIETRGDALYNPVVAIGVYLAPQDPKRIGQPGVLTEKRRWALRPLPGQTDQKECMDEFWAKFKSVDEWIRANERPAVEVMLELRDWCRQQVQAVGGPKRIELVSDCPDFDLGRLDYLGHATGTWDRPLRYLDSGVRHSAVDPGERLEQLGPQADEAFKRWAAAGNAPAHIKHSHFPDDDAEYNYWQMVYCNAHRGDLK
jgi:hypothetical protein